MILYFIKTKRDPCKEHPPWAEMFKEKYICQGYGCSEIEYDKISNGIDVWVDDKPGVSALCTVQPAGVNIARRDFLNLFSDEVDRYLKLGNVYNVKEDILEQYATYRGDTIILRGSRKSDYHGFCKQCGKPRYWPAYPWHILKDSLLNQPIYVCWPFKGLIITEELKSRIVPGQWKGIYIVPVPVVDEPQDGISEIPARLSDIRRPVEI
jgi:hypothetical protein